MSVDEAGPSELNVPSKECLLLGTVIVVGDVLDMVVEVVVNVLCVVVVVVESILKNVPSSPRSSLLVLGLSV